MNIFDYFYDIDGGMLTEVVTDKAEAVQPLQGARFRGANRGDILRLQLAQSSSQKSSFWLLLREVQRPFIGGASFRCSSQSAAEIRTSGVGQMIGF